MNPAILRRPRETEPDETGGRKSSSVRTSFQRRDAVATGVTQTIQPRQLCHEEVQTQVCDAAGARYLAGHFTCIIASGSPAQTQRSYDVQPAVFSHLIFQERTMKAR